MNASERWLAILARTAPFGGPFQVPFPGKCCPVYVYEKAGGAWGPAAVLFEEIDQNLPAGSVGLSGSRVVHGLPHHSSGAGPSAGSVFTYLADPIWRREQEIVSPEPTAGAFFGFEVALEGDTLAVVALGSGGTPSFLYIYSLQQGLWIHVQTITPPPPFGRFQGMALEGRWLAAASFEDSGAVFLYERTAVGFQWRHTLVPPQGGSFGGHAVELAAGFLAIPGAAQSGRVYLYREAGSGWQPHQQLDSADWPDCTSGFGANLAMTSHKLLVSAPAGCVMGQPNAGFARLYQREGNQWMAAGDFTDASPAGNEFFGEGVAIGRAQIFVNFGNSASNFTEWKIDVYDVPRDPLPRLRPVRR